MSSAIDIDLAEARAMLDQCLQAIERGTTHTLRGGSEHGTPAADKVPFLLTITFEGDYAPNVHILAGINKIQVLATIRGVIGGITAGTQAALNRAELALKKLD